MTDKQLAVINNFETMQQFSTALFKSGYFTDVKSEAQAIVKVMAGQELGLPAFASMAGIHIVQGKPVLGSNVIATLVKNDPRYDYHIIKCDDKECVIEWSENGNKVGQSAFSFKEADAAGISNKPTWKAYPSDMLFARAISRGARRFAPGIFGGSPVYTPDEMNVDENEDGYVVTVLNDEPITNDIDEPTRNATPAKSNGNGGGKSADSKPTASMTLETAQNVTNSEGTKYGDLDSATLSNMTIGIGKAINKADAKKREEYQMKLDAISVILTDRATLKA